MTSMLYSEAKKREASLAEFLKDIVSIPSLSSQEGDVVKFMAEAMKTLGYDEVKIDGMGNLLGRIGNGPRVIAFDGHCDTVDIGDISLWTQQKPYPGVVDKAAGVVNEVKEKFSFDEVVDATVEDITDEEPKE